MKNSFVVCLAVVLFFCPIQAQKLQNNAESVQIASFKMQWQLLQQKYATSTNSLRAQEELIRATQIDFREVVPLQIELANDQKKLKAGELLRIKKAHRENSVNSLENAEFEAIVADFEVNKLVYSKEYKKREIRIYTKELEMIKTAMKIERILERSEQINRQMLNLHRNLHTYLLQTIDTTRDHLELTQLELNKSIPFHMKFHRERHQLAKKGYARFRRQSRHGNVADEVLVGIKREELEARVDIKRIEMQKHLAKSKLLEYENRIAELRKLVKAVRKKI